MPANMQASLIFHYNLKFYDNDTDTFEATSLKRFVMQVHNQLLHIKKTKQYESLIGEVEFANVYTHFRLTSTCHYCVRLMMIQLIDFCSRWWVTWLPSESTPLAVVLSCWIFSPMP